MAYKRKRAGTATSSRRTSYRRTSGGRVAKPRVSRRTTRRPATRRRSTYRGIGRSIGSTVGGMIAPGVLGSAAGSMLGSGAGAIIDHITGQGDYTIKSNSLIKAAPVPSFGKGCMRLQHREMISGVLSSTNFNLNSYYLQPGDRNTFPWLSQIAQNFEMYKFHGLIFEFVSTSGDALNNTNTALGKVILATDYNVIDPLYQNEQQMYATEFSNSGKPAVNLIHAVECAPKENPLKLYYIRTSLGVPNNADRRFYDMGVTQIAVSGCQSIGNQIGELWVSYDVSLCKPSIQAVQFGADLLAGHARLTSYDETTGPFLRDNNMLMTSGSNISWQNFNTHQIILDPKITTQHFLVVCQWRVATALAAPDIVNGWSITNGAVEAFWQNGLVGFNAMPPPGGTVSRYGFMAVIRANVIPGQQVVLNFNDGLTYGDITSFDMVVTQIPDSMT